MGNGECEPKLLREHFCKLIEGKGESQSPSDAESDAERKFQDQVLTQEKAARAAASAWIDSVKCTPPCTKRGFVGGEQKGTVHWHISAPRKKGGYYVAFKWQWVCYDPTVICD
jgi:hypothetical protein